MVFDYLSLFTNFNICCQILWCYPSNETSFIGSSFTKYYMYMNNYVYKDFTEQIILIYYFLVNFFFFGHY